MNILIIGVGGLGSRMVQEGLERGLNVSVLVRNRDKLVATVGDDVVSRLTRVTVGDGTDPAALDEAMRGIDVVLSGRGADPALALPVAQAVKRNGVAKLCWPAGTTNVLADDGETLNYITLLSAWPGAKFAYDAHQACIDAIREEGITSVVFCPGVMRSTGHRSADVESTVRINRDAGPFVSYEDAAWVMLEGAVTDRFDGQLVSAATPR